MSEQTRSTASGFTISLVCGIVFLLAYILSPIPIFVMLHHAGFEENEWVESAAVTIYFPISWAAENSPAVSAFYEYQEKLCEQIGIMP